MKLVLWFVFFAVLARGNEPPGYVDYMEPDIPLGSFNAKEITITELLHRIAREKQVNIVADDRMRERVSLRLNDTTLNELLNLLVRTYNVRCEPMGKILHVKPAPPPEPIPLVNQIDFDSESGTLAFNLTGIGVREFAQRVTAMTGRNVLPAERNLEATLRGFQAPLPFEKGLAVFLASNGLVLTPDDGIFYIGTPKARQDQAGKAEEKAGKAREVSGGIRFENGMFDLTYDQTPLEKILEDLAATGAVSLVVQGKPEVVLSIDVKQVDIDSLFRLILSDSDFGYVHRDGIYTVAGRMSKAVQARKIIGLNHLNAEMVAHTLPSTLKEGATVSVVKELNSLLLTGGLSEITTLADLVAELDKPVPQVLIEVIVVDYNFDNNRKLGLELSNGQNLLFPELNLTLDGFRDAEGSFQVRRLPSNFPLTIRALETRGMAKIISKPHVAALNGHEASIKIGSKQFYRISTEELVGNENPRVRTSQEIREIEANIFLKITPWVSGSGEVTTLIEPTFTSFLGQVDDNIPPPISSRELKSTIRLKDGETIILGGLIQNFDTMDHRGVPFISKVPILGALFRNQDKQSQRSELVIYITPHIYHGDEGSVEFIKEREGMEYQLDVVKQKLGIEAVSPQKKSWFQRRKERKQKRRKQP